MESPSSPKLDLSLSHCRGLAIVGVGVGGQIGVDVERHAPPDSLKIARSWFAPDEVAWLERLPQDQRARRFLECWTRKEAYLKAAGVGLSGDLKACRCNPSSDGTIVPRIISLDGECDETWQFISLDNAGTVACAVVNYDPVEVVVRAFDWVAGLPFVAREL